MSFNGDGTFTPPSPAYPAISGEVIYADYFNQIIADIAAGFANTITRDGQSPALANISFGGFRLTNMATGVAPTDAVNVLQVFTSPNFTDATLSGTTVTINATNLTVTSTTVTLPAGTSIGTVSAAELLTLDGVTSSIQTQLNAKGAIAGQTWTGTQDFTSADVTVKTAAAGTNTTQAASTAFVQTTAFNSALPSQSAATTFKFVQSNGTNASWQYSSQDRLNYLIGVI